MIFKTVNADAKKLTEQFGLLNKSFRDIKKDFANGLGFKNSLFQTSISKTDYQALQKFNSAIKVTNDGLTKSQRITKAWNENMTGCSMAAKRMGNDLITGKQKIGDISNSMKTATASTKALEVAMNVFANVGFMLAITAISKVVSELAQAQENAVQAAKEATETYKSELDSITDYKQRLSELHEELKSGNLSYEETKTKRIELMTIQDELIEKFGTEKGAIESVTEAVNGRVDALDELNEKTYRDWLAKADEQTFWNKLLPGGKSGLDQAIDYMETEKTVSFMDMQNANLSDELQEIQKEIDETIQSKYNLEKSFATFKVTGTPDEIKSQLESIRQDYLDLSKEAFLENGISSEYWEKYRSEAIDSINDVINKFDEGLEKHQETYQTYIEGMIKYDSEYSDEYANILRKRAELESAQNSGSEEEIKKAKQEFMDSINNAIIASDSDENIKKYFESLYPELQAEFANWSFEFDLEANKGLEDTAKEIGEKYTATDLLDMVNTEGVQEGEESFNKLIDKAIKYGVCTDKSAEEVQKLIDLLVELGYVQGEVQGSTLNETDNLWNYSTTITQLDTIKEKFDVLDSTLSKLYDTDKSTVIGFDDFSSINEAFKDLDGIETYIQRLQEAGQDTEAVTAVMSDLISAYLECSGVLDNVTDENRQLITSMLEEMGVANAEEVVNGYLMTSMREINEAKQALGITTEKLSDLTLNEIQRLIEEGNCSEQTKNKLYELYLTQIDLNNNPIDATASINQLLSMVDASSTAGTALTQLASIMGKIGQIQQYMSTTNGEISQSLAKNTLSRLEKQAASIKSNALAEFSKNTTTTPSIKVNPTANYKGGSSTQKAIKDAAEEAEKAAEKAAKELENQFKETFDFFERRIKVLDDALSLLKTNLDNVTGSFAKNKLIDAELGITEEKFKNYTDALSMYTEKANEALSKLPSDIAQKIKDGAVDLTTFIGDGNEEVVEAIKDYQNWADKIADCKQELAELKTAIRQLELEKFNNIMEDFTNQFDLHEDGKDLISKQISLLKEAGQLIGESFFTTQIDQSKKQLAILEEEKAKLVEQLNSALSSGRVNLCPAV